MPQRQECFLHSVLGELSLTADSIGKRVRHERVLPKQDGECLGRPIVTVGESVHQSVFTRPILVSHWGEGRENRPLGTAGDTH